MGSNVAKGARKMNTRNARFTIEDVRKRGLVWDGHSLPYDPNLVENARSLRKGMTMAEKKLWYDFLRVHKKKFYRQRPIDHFIADFYCAECGLIIEIDGSQHYTAEGLKRDTVRADVLSLYGLEILRFTNNDVVRRFDAVCRAIEEKSARKVLDDRMVTKLRPQVTPQSPEGEKDEGGRDPSGA
jgi:very-short-patch-repair endonuclease